LVSAGVRSAARAVVSAALPVNMVTAMAPANAVLTNVRLLVLIVPFIVVCRLNDTVTVFAHSAA
jgi:hypothetical protein